MGRVFGIDLGTTYSCIAYIDDYNKPVVLKNSEGDHTTPSVVLVETQDNIVVGAEAKRSIEVEPEKTVQFIKRKMGKEKDRVVLNGISYSAPEISAYILKKLVKDANGELQQTGVLAPGEEILDVVITCPAYFGMNERQATKTAGELAGLHVLDIINEPTAAAISYGVSGSRKEETVLVYDLGGGTFDITVMHMRGSEISVICTGGDDSLGGKDWDEALMDYVTGRYEEETGEDLSEDPEAVAALYVDVETWKKALTVREKVNISVNGPAGRFREELTRQKQEELTEELLLRTKNLLDEVLRIAAQKGYPLSAIDQILLVGGSSRMPQVAAMLEKDYGVKPVLTDPDEAVAKGAAIYAGNQREYHDFVLGEAQKAGKSVEEMLEEDNANQDLTTRFQQQKGMEGTRLQINNVLSRTYGLELVDADSGERVIFNMLMMNDRLPATKTETFATVSDGQTAISIKIHESLSMEKKMALEDRLPLTRIDMQFSREVPKDTLVEMTMDLDHSGILHIQAEEQFSHSKLNTSFRLSAQMTEEERLEAYRRMERSNVE